MLNRHLLDFFKSPNNGRQLARLHDGRWLALTHSEIMGPAELRLSVSRSERPPKSLADFEEVASLVGPAGVVPECGPWGFGGSLFVDGQTIHLAWSGPHGVQYARADASAKPKWTQAQTVRHGDCWLGDLFNAGRFIALTYQETHDRQTESVGVCWQDGRWNTAEVHRGKPCFAPVADVDAAGHIHLAWGDVAEQLYHGQLVRLDGDARVELLGNGRAPTILCADDQVVIVGESEYGHLRYYVRSADGTWERHLPLTNTNAWLTSDEIHSPGLTRDRHGVVWLFFANSTRQSTFWARWMGDRWSDLINGPRIYYRRPRFDSNLLPIGRLSVEKTSGPQRHDLAPSDQADKEGAQPDIGLLITCEPPIRRSEFRREQALTLQPVLGRRILFLDMLEVAQSDNVTLEVESAVKHPANPLMERGPVGAFDHDRVFNHGCVMKEGGKYRMWYAALREPRRGEPYSPWYDWIRCGYAESEDGITWRRIRVGDVEWNGSRDNNILAFFRHSPIIFRDDRDPDERRRYKAFYFWNSGEHLDIARSGKYGKSWDPRDERFLVDVLTSPDGIHFEREEGEVVFPGEQAKPLSLIPQSVFRDDEEPDVAKRYKAYGFMSMNLRRRGTSYITSPDCVHWTAHPELPVIDPSLRGTPPAAGGPTGQVHDTVCFPYEGYCLALYQDQHDPLNMPVELAVSRDSEWFRHVKPGQKVIAVGAPDQWDAQTILPTMPVILEEEIRLYYGGGSERREANGAKRSQALPGLATLRRDGFTSIRLIDQRASGTLTTIPCQVPARAQGLHLNVDCPSGAEMRVELLDVRTRKPVKGYSLNDCDPVMGDRLNVNVGWRGRPRLPIEGGTVALRFVFRSQGESPRLFSFWFA